MWNQEAKTFLMLLALCHHLAFASDTSSPDLTGHLKPFGAQGPVSEIEHVDGFLPPKEFLNNYVAKNRPVLFKGAAKLSPAFTKWTDEYLMLKTPPRPAGDVKIEPSKKEDRSLSRSVIHFKDFLRDYNTSDNYMVSYVPHFIREDLVLPFPLQCPWFVKGAIDLPLAWFSSGGTSSVIHYDTYDNINCLLRGRKSVIFLNSTRYFGLLDKIIDQPERAFSSVDVDRIDLESRPEFSDLKFHMAEVQPGDCLFIPSVWIHQIRSFGSNFAVNLWWYTKAGQNDASKCLSQFNRDLTLNRVFFDTELKSARDDLEYVKQILTSNLKLPATQSDLLNLLSIGDADGISTSWPQFPTKVAALFNALDISKDGELTVKELTRDVKPKVALDTMKLVLAYNVDVFAMHQAADPGVDVGKLPKLLNIMSSGSNEFYAAERTWQSGQLGAGNSTINKKDKAEEDDY